MRDWREEVSRRMAGSGLTPEAEAEVVEELAQHLEDRYGELVGGGLEPEEARRRTLRELDSGGLAAGDEVGAGGRSESGLGRAVAWARVRGRGKMARRGGRDMVLSGWMGDVRYAVRTLGRTPGYSAAVLLTLALGIGAVSAVQAVIQPLLLRPLAFHDPDRLVTLDELLIPGEYPIITRHTTAFEGSALMRAGVAFGLSGDGEPERVRGARVTPELFATLGVSPVAGALPEAGAGESALLSYDLWQRRFGGSGEVIGGSVRLDGRPVMVVGVLPPGFSYPARTQLWLAASLDPADVSALWGTGGYGLVARLRDGATSALAEAEIRALSAHLSAANPFWTPSAEYRADVRVISLHRAMVGEVRRPLLLLGAAVAALLLIACANVGNLVLARGLGRARELAVRAALGASPRRIARQLLTETMVLAGAGGVVGIGLALVAVRAVRGVLPADTPRIEEIGIDLRVVAATLGLTVLTGLLLGVLPARRVMRFDLHASLRDGPRGVGDRSGRRLSGVLVIAQVALAVVLVSAAGLLGQSVLALHRADTGIARPEVVTARLDLPTAQYGQAAQRRAFFDALVLRLEGMPGVRSVAVTSQVPFSGHYQGSAMLVEHVTTDPNDLPMFLHRRVTPQFFDALGVPLRQGRLFGPSDAAPDGLPVAIVDEAAAREFWPGEDPIGKRLGRPWMNELLQVVGVVGSVLDGDLAGAPERSVYTPLEREPPHSAFIVLHSWGGLGVVPVVRSVVRQLDPTVPISEIGTVRSLVAGTLTAPRLLAGLLAGFGALALLLAAIGIYGLLAYAVAQRGRELALRLALGARAGDLLRMVLRQGMVLTGIGATLGIAGALALARVLGGMLHGVEPQDPTTLVTVTVVVLIAAAVATIVPARRASRAEPMRAMRE